MNHTINAAVHHAGYRCYACSIDVSGKYRNEWNMTTVFCMYESAVEYIEGLPVGATFNRMSVWRALGRGYKLNGIVYHVIRDMYVHGLLVCVRKSGYRCFDYQVRRDLDVPREARQNLSHACTAGHPASAPGHDGLP